MAQEARKRPGTALRAFRPWAGGPSAAERPGPPLFTVYFTVEPTLPALGLHADERRAAAAADVEMPSRLEIRHRVEPP